MGANRPKSLVILKTWIKKYENETWLQKSTIRKYTSWALLEFNLENELHDNNYIFQGQMSEDNGILVYDDYFTTQVFLGGFLL